MNRKILFSDETNFTCDGVNYTRSSHLWDRDNYRGTVDSNYQHRFSVNVWCDVIGDQLIGPYIFPQHLTGDIYANFLQDELLLQNVLYKHDDRCIISMTERRLISVRS